MNHTGGRHAEAVVATTRREASSGASRSDRAYYAELDAEARERERKRKRCPRAAFLEEVVTRALHKLREEGRESERLFLLSLEISQGIDWGLEAAPSVMDSVELALKEVGMLPPWREAA